MKRSVRAFSLAEVLLAFALIAVALLALVGHSLLLVNSTQKHDDHTVAADVARSVLERLSQQVKLEQPPGRSEQVLSANSASTPFEEGVVTVGETEYSYRVTVTDVENSTVGAPLGTGVSGDPTALTRLKRLDVSVSWWGSDEEPAQRSGYGRLQVESSRLLKVTRRIEE